jgi:hypothetical protein
MTEQKQITSQDEYQRAQKRLEELKRSNPNSAEVQELQRSVDQYKSQNPNAEQGGSGKPRE